MDLRNFRKNTDDEDKAWAELLQTEEADSVPEPRPEPPRGSQTGLRGDYGTLTTRRPAPSRPQPQKPRVLAPPEKKTRKKQPKQSTNDEAAISIEIRMPQVHIPKPNIPWRKFRPWFIGAVVLFVLLFGGKFLVDKISQKAAPKDTTPASTKAAIDLGYKPIIPVKPNPEDTPKPSYNSEKKLYTFLDTYMDANLTVDQQALPDSFKQGDKAVKDLAAYISAKDSFSTTKGKAYISTDDASGAQRLFVYNDKMLMFIQSTAKLDVPSWVEYIQSME